MTEPQTRETQKDAKARLVAALEEEAPEFSPTFSMDAGEGADASLECEGCGGDCTCDGDCQLPD